MKEVILKATDGSSILLTIENTESFFPRIIELVVIENETHELKVGDWAYHIRDKYVFEIIEVSACYVRAYGADAIVKKECRLATDKEIHVHTQELLRRHKKAETDAAMDRELKSSLLNRMSTKGKLRMSIDNLIRDGFGTVGHVQKLKDIVDAMTGYER